MTLIIDAKHLLYGISMLDQYKGILLSALCVDRWQIMEDYLLTNERNGGKFPAKESYLGEAFSAIGLNSMFAIIFVGMQAMVPFFFPKNKNFTVLKPTPCIYYFVLV